MSGFLLAARDATSDEVGLLFILLAFVAFAAAIYCAVTNRFVAAGVAAFVGIVILMFS